MIVLPESIEFDEFTEALFDALKMLYIEDVSLEDLPASCSAKLANNFGGMINGVDWSDYEEDDDESMENADEMIGYPTNPLYVVLAQRLLLWLRLRYPPIHLLPRFSAFEEQPDPEPFDEITTYLVGAQSLWSFWNKFERAYRLRLILIKLGLHGIKRLLGMRRTVGSDLQALPPARSTLRDSYNSTCNEKTALTVGARALSKHFHRDSSKAFWGECRGSEKDKNKHANALLGTILEKAKWINVHQLPGSLPILEIRVAAGYGARFSPDGTEFRGFLEPHVVDGHLTGWKHGEGQEFD